MRPDERDLAATRLRQIADEIGLSLTEERLAGMVWLFEATVDGTREAATLAGPEDLPAFTPDLDEAEGPA